MKKILLSLGLCFGLMASAQYPYKVIAPLPLDEGAIVYLYNFDTGDKVDSVAVADHAAVFTGTVDEPWVARIIGTDGKRYGTFILEQGTTAINEAQRKAVGSMLNDAFNDFQDKEGVYIQKYNEATTDEARQSTINEMLTFMQNSIADNLDSPLGYMMFMDYAQILDGDELMAFVNQYPELKKYRRVQSQIASIEKKLATSAGQPYIDFEVEYDGKVQKFSDYVGEGKYTLVDFWASWCGPCVREMKVLKEIYDEYADKGLQVVGVAVWDKPEDTLAAIDRLQIPWPVIINAQTIPTDIYGIQGIPAILVIGPDGTIISRDARGDDLKAVIANVMK